MAMNVSRQGLAFSDPPVQIGKAAAYVEYGVATISFTEPRGTGTSRYWVRLDPASFGDVVQAMMHANAEEAIKAFAASLQDGIPAPKDIWHQGMDQKPATAA
jgi:hypothetical protein